METLKCERLCVFACLIFLCCSMVCHIAFFIQTSLLKPQFDQGLKPSALGEALCEFYYSSLFNPVILKHEEEAI